MTTGSVARRASRSRGSESGPVAGGPVRLANFVDGGYVAPVDGAYVDIIDPCTGEAYLSAPASTKDDVELAMSAAATAFESWRRTTPAHRQEALLRVAAALETRVAEFGAAEARNTGSAAAAHETPLMVDQLRFFAGAARILDGLSAGEYVDAHTSYVRREPVGVCAQLAPWNFPLLMAVLKSAPAVAAGNTVVLKPAGTTPVTALMFADLAAEFLPPGVINVVCGGRETGRMMVEHRVPAMVSLTGSVAAGMDVAAVAARSLKRVHLELGGKTPVVVFGSADLDAAAEKILAGAYGNAGQDCTAATRIIVDVACRDELVRRLVDGSKATHAGPPSDSTAGYGPLNSAEHLARVEGFINRLPAHAQVLTGGSRIGDSGYFFAPTVIVDVHQDDEIIQNEVFGPVITVQSFDTEAEAVELANGVAQGLACAVWTTDHAQAMRMSGRLDFGCVWVNTHLGFPSEMPHGGFKHSGYGKDLSFYGFEDYTRVKHVMHHIGG